MARGVYQRISVADRFWAKVDRSGGPDACWPWIAGSRHERGYGRFHLDGRPVQATHVALLLDGRPIAPGKEACHTCDTPECCNPRHLVEGTHTENIADRDAKGRQARGPHHGASTRPERVLRGEDVGTARLTADQVAEIRRRFTGRRGEQVAFAREYGVSTSLMNLIVHGKVWAAL